jgi:hypothetical protein
VECNRSQGGHFLQGHKLHLSPVLQAWPSVGKAEPSVVSGGEGGGDAFLHGVPADNKMNKVPGTSSMSRRATRSITAQVLYVGCAYRNLGSRT